MNKLLLVFGLVLLSLFLFGCTSSDLTIPFTNSQLITQSTDLNYDLFKTGFYDGNFLTIDNNKLSVSVIDFNDEEIPWSSLIDFPSGCGDNQAVKIVGSSLVCIDLPEDTNFETAGYDFNNYLKLNGGTMKGNIDYNINQTGKTVETLIFDGSTTYVETGITYDEFTGEPFSVSAWINPSNLSQKFSIITLLDDVPQEIMFNFRVTETGFVNGNQVLNFWVSDDGSNVTQIYGSTTLEENNWYLATALFNGNELQLFLNGESDATPVEYTYETMNVSNTGNVLIGGLDSSDTDSFAEGKIQQAGVWQRRLTELEIKDLYNQGKGRLFDKNDLFPSSGTRFYLNSLGIYDLNNNANDLSGNGNGGTVNGTEAYGNALITIPNTNHILDLINYEENNEGYIKSINSFSDINSKTIINGTNIELNGATVFGKDEFNNLFTGAWSNIKDFYGTGYNFFGYSFGEYPTSGVKTDRGFGDNYSSQFMIDKANGSIGITGIVPSIRQVVRREGGGVAFEMFDLIGSSTDTGLNNNVGSIGMRGQLEDGVDNKPYSNMIGISTSKPAYQWYNKFQLAVGQDGIFINPNGDDILSYVRNPTYNGLQVWDGGISVHGGGEIQTYGTSGDISVKDAYNGDYRSRLGYNSNGGFLATYDNSDNMASIIRGYSIDGVQAYFNKGGLEVAGAIATGSNTFNGLSNGDINASTIYYDTLTAKSPMFMCSNDWCSVGFPKHQKTLYINKNKDWSINSIVYEGTTYNKQGFWNLVKGTQYEDLVLKLNAKLNKLQDKYVLNQKISDCKKQGYDWNGNCVEHYKESVSYFDAVEEKPIYDTIKEEYACTKIFDNNLVEYETVCSETIKTSEVIGYETVFKDSCDWSRELGYYCEKTRIIN